MGKLVLLWVSEEEPTSFSSRKEAKSVSLSLDLNIFDLTSIWMETLMPDIVERREITISETKKILEEIENLTPFQNRTLEYATKFSKHDSIQAAELVNKLISHFEIERKDAIEVVNCMPTSIVELRSFFSTGRKRLIITSKLEDMLKIINDYR
jgi:DNA-directed RNA polymerase subunit F